MTNKSEISFHSAGIHRLDLGVEMQQSGWRPRHRDPCRSCFQHKKSIDNAPCTGSLIVPPKRPGPLPSAAPHNRGGPTSSSRTDTRHAAIHDAPTIHAAALSGMAGSSNQKRMDSKPGPHAADGTSQRLTWIERYQREQGELREQGTGAQAWPQQHIPADNVGYGLLRKAGWSEGTGLGVSEQGRVAPVQPWLQKGNRGIGFDHKAAQLQQAKEQTKKGERQTVEKQASRARATAEQAVGAARNERVAGIVDEELKGEDLETKLKLHKQVILQEHDDAKRKAISQLLSNALNDPFDMPFSTGDSNPLRRKHRLTALNPLLDDDEY